ncbi:uncharacterized protein LOC108623077 [Ceratina calcarata]|uniref:Uncharacterized protein LOC108623077 n=1 Tax=Ceratina calcarata TaxID=156304 RepID=A0AAJ7ITJ1_9HYME|nr:uncharacterized protein LOC108623077 [Ceratina calcarata]
MIKQLTILFSAIVLVQSQRPPYAGSSKPYPGVLPQYLDAQTTTAPTTSSSNQTGIGNRIDVSSSSVGPALGAAPPSVPTIPQDLPVDALGDIELINRIKTWPREKQPFWFINWQQIQEHRGDVNNRVQPPQTQPNTRPFFAG